MTPVQTALEQVKKAQEALKSHLAIPASDRNDTYAAKRDSLVAELEGLKADFSAAQMLDLPEDEAGSKAKAQKEQEAREKAAVGRQPIGQTKDNRILKPDFKAAREAISRREASIEIPCDVKSMLNARTKAVTRTDSGILPGYEDLEILPVRAPQLLDYLPKRTTNANAITFRRQTTKLDDSAARSEGTALAASSFAATRVSVPVEAIGQVFDVTIEEIEDDPGLQQFLSQAMDDVMRELDEQCAIGNGTAPNLTGIVNASGIQTQAYSNSRAYSIKTAMTSLKTTERAAPGVHVMNPTDWDLLINDMIATPSFAISYIQGGFAPRLWGLPVAEQEDITAGYTYVLDPSLFPLYVRQALTMDYTNSDGSKFNELVGTYRVYLRAALVMRRLGVRKVDITA